MFVEKTRFSAFLPNSSDIAARLRGRGIDTVLIAGTVTNTCCESSARDAMMMDFKTIMIEDANAAPVAEAHAAALANFLQVLGDVRTTDEVVALLQGTAVTA
jgi:ureidoacrylate peracid hydrolase